MNTAMDSDPTKAGQLSLKIVELLKDEELETRRRAIQSALMLLGETPSKPVPLDILETGVSETSQLTVADLATFIANAEAALKPKERMKPSDYAQLCAAFHFSQYGMAEFTAKEIEAIGREGGLVLPDVLYMTLTKAAKNGKRLFQANGKGMFKPTAMAGLAFKERWGVRPGKKVKLTSKKDSHAEPNRS